MVSCCLVGPAGAAIALLLIAACLGTSSAVQVHVNMNTRQLGQQGSKTREGRWWPWSHKKSSTGQAKDDRIHLTMLSDRQVGSAAAIESVCRNAAQPSRLHFHVIAGQVNNTRWNLTELAPTCAKDGADMSLYSLDEMIERVERAGFWPVWKWSEWSGAGLFTVHPAEWDNSTTHRHPFNLLRFYLPHIAPFKNLDQVLFMDDDVIVLKDVARAWEYKLQENAIMSASCHNWVWSDCDRFKSSTSLSYLDVPYFGFGRIGNDRTVSDALCKDKNEKECMPKGFMELLSNASLAINGPNHMVSEDILKNTKAWNYGFNKFDLKLWRSNGITEKYVQWMKLNHQYRMFPETSLAFGLGVAMLAKVGRVQCYDADTPVVQGLGFVGKHDMHDNGHSADALHGSFALHFNGPRKPWDPNSGNPYAAMFLRYLPQRFQNSFNKVAKAQTKQRQKRSDSNFTSFILLTDPRSGSEWFMDMLDKHPEICASGEADDSAVGFPRESLVPGRYSRITSKQRALDMLGAKQNVGAVGSLSLLSMNRSLHKASAPRNYYTPSAPAAHPSAAKSMSGGGGMVDVEIAPDGSNNEVNICTVKAGCSWATLSSLIWQASTHKKTCDGFGTALGTRDWSKRSELSGFGRHLETVCTIQQRAVWHLKHKMGVRNPSPAQVLSQSFRVFFRHQMRSSLHLNDAGYGSDTEAKQVLPCKCPKSALITGQKIMHDWIGEAAPDNTAAVEDWKENPWDINFNAPKASAELGAPMFDLVDAMQEVGTRAIVFERQNLLARFVSLTAASQTGIYHCHGEACLKSAPQPAVEVDVSKLREFIDQTAENHAKNMALMEEAGIETLHLTYEFCVKERAQCLEKATKFLGVSAPPASLAQSSSLQKTVENLPDRIHNLEEVTHALSEYGYEHWLLDRVSA